MSGRGISKRGRESVRESVRENHSRVGFTRILLHTLVHTLVGLALQFPFWD